VASVSSSSVAPLSVESIPRIRSSFEPALRRAADRRGSSTPRADPTLRRRSIRRRSCAGPAAAQSPALPPRPCGGLIRAQQLVIELANRLDRLPQPLIVRKPAAHLGRHLAAQTELPRASAGVAHRQHRRRSASRRRRRAGVPFREISGWQDGGSFLQIEPTACRVASGAWRPRQPRTSAPRHEESKRSVHLSCLHQNGIG